jgi:signal transduction histidine kinase
MPRFLHLEDDPRDHKLVRAALLNDGIDHEIEHVDGADAYRARLASQSYELILADFNLLQFDGFEAMRIARQLCPDTPFIIVSGVMGDMAVADILRAGATDFVLKEHLERLGPAIRRALREAAERRARAAAEAATREARDAAESANRAKDRFLATLSHELRTPLSPVVMALKSIAADPDLPEKFRDDLQMVRRNIDLEAALIDDLLDLSRVMTGKLRLRPAPAGIHAILQHVIASTTQDVADKRHTLSADLQAHCDVVNGDAARLQQVFWNLVRNAIKFTPPGGRISVRSSDAPNGAIRVEIRDSGRGIHASALPRLFEPFEQVSTEITREFGGLGLGLAVVKAVVELHHGHAWAESEGPGKGAAFFVELPTAQTGAQRASARPSPAPASAKPAPVRVLLVEDHEDTLRVLSRLLANSGFDVEVARCYADAIELATSRRFDLLVSDIGLPDATGYDLMEALRQRYGMKGIALTGYGMDHDIARSRDAGFVEHIIKPVDFDQLQKAILIITERRGS